MHHNHQEFIGVDLGSKRVGLARGSSFARLAQPLKTVDINQVLNELTALPADGIVVGLPRGLDGQETAQTKYVRDWVKIAQKQINKPFFWQDEALTTVAAGSDLTAEVDAVAASVILQDFLDTPLDQRVRC